MKKEIEEQFGLNVLQFFKHGPYEAFRTRRNICLIIPVSSFEDEELYEMYQMAQHMLGKKERNVAMFLQTKQGALRFQHENETYSIVQISFYSTNQEEMISGKSLAKFHQRGRSFAFPVTKTNRIGKWKGLWEKRLDQLEMFWRGKVHTKPLQSFDRLFVESFPYYVGLCENAIQYLVDTELDDDPYPIDSATICYHRFTPDLFKDTKCKLPTEWVYDHASRDIAEYIRYEFVKNHRVVNSSFLEEYDRTTPLSSFYWRLIFSRLLFPVHYFECVENYYLAQDEGSRNSFENELQLLLDNTKNYEQLLTSFSSMLSMRTRKIHLPKIHWLS